MIEVIVSKKFIMNFWRLFAAAEAACLSARMSRVRKIGWRVEMEIGSLRASRDHHRVMRVASLEHSINASRMDRATLKATVKEISRDIHEPSVFRRHAGGKGIGERAGPAPRQRILAGAAPSAASPELQASSQPVFTVSLTTFRATLRCNCRSASAVGAGAMPDTTRSWP